MNYEIITDKISFTKRFYRVLLMTFVCIVFSSILIMARGNKIWNVLPVSFIFCFIIFMIFGSRYRRYIFKINCEEDILRVTYLDFNKEKETTFDRNSLKITREIVPSRSFTKSHFIKLYQSDRSTLKIYPFSSWDIPFWDENKINEVYGELLKWQNGAILS